jgi:hypothetical protein
MCDFRKTATGQRSQARKGGRTVRLLIDVPERAKSKDNIDRVLQKAIKVLTQTGILYAGAGRFRDGTAVILLIREKDIDAAVAALKKARITRVTAQRGEAKGLHSSNGNPAPAGSCGCGL